MKLKRLIELLIILLCILLAVDSVHSESSQADERGTISVTGTASENYPPDTAEIVLAIETTAIVVSQATEKNRTISERVINSLREFINKDEGDTIKTSSYTLQPMYEYDPKTNKNKFTGYKVTNQVTVRTKQIRNVGTFVDSAIEEGINRVDNITFTISDDKEYCNNLLEKATKRAQLEAETVARSLGVKISGVKEASVSCGTDFQRPIYRFGAMQEEAGMAKSTTPVEAGTIMLRSSVTAIFYIVSQ